MQLNLTNLPPAILSNSFSILAHSSHLTLDKTACFTLTKSQDSFAKLDFALIKQADNYVGSSYFTEDGERDLLNCAPDSISLDYVQRLRSNILLFYMFLVEISYAGSDKIDQLLLVYDSEYSEVMMSFLAAYYVLKDEHPDEAVALSVSSNPSSSFDYPTVCFLDMMLECSQRLIEAVETYEVMDVVVTKSGLITEREF